MAAQIFFIGVHLIYLSHFSIIVAHLECVQCLFIINYVLENILIYITLSLEMQFIVWKVRTKVDFSGEMKDIVPPTETAIEARLDI